MHLADDRLIFFATDLSNFLACPQLTLLELRAARGGPKAPRYDDPALEALRKRGEEHEQQILECYRSQGKTISILAERTELSGIEKWRTQAALTLEEMKRGVDVVYQGTLFDERWGGRPDFLVKVPRPSALGDWSYEVVDAKLAREAKGGALLQVLHYADLLERVQGVAPEYVHLALGGPDAHTESFRVNDYAAYFRMLRRRFEEFVVQASDPQPAPDPVAHCNICAWHSICDRERHDADHLSLVAGITKHQRNALVARGITTLEALANITLPLKPKLDDISDAALERIHRQAQIQLQGRREGKPRYELLEVVPEQGLAALPAPSEGDLFFDLEGDPFAYTYGIEYLFGYADAQGNYYAKWALTPDEEKRAFEEFIDFVMQRLEQYPDMHIYHFAPYETTALKRLMGRYGTREDEVDRLLRGKVLVDLYRVVRQGLRASVESYSIKKLEAFYGYKRDVDLTVANRALATFAASLELGTEIDRAQLPEIEGYNRDDVISTLRLRNWLESLRTPDMPRPAPKDPNPDEDQAQVQWEVARVVAQLTEGISADPNARTAEEHARWLLAQLLEFHRREKKAYWWDYFRRLALTEEELLEERDAIAGLEFVGEFPDPKPTKRSRSKLYRYRFPIQEHSFKVGSRAVNPDTQKAVGEVFAINDAECTIDFRKQSKPESFRALVLDEHVSDVVMRESLLRFGRFVAEHGFAEREPYRAAIQLLLRSGPRLADGEAGPLVRAGEDTLAAAKRLVHALDHGVLPIQGPPGAGKTYTAARMIVEALRAGKRVGISANSHKVIAYLLQKTCEAAEEAGMAITGIQKCKPEEKCARDEIACSDENADVLDALQNGKCLLAAGTAWLWSREEMAGSVDYLFIDEAGQCSLANALAMAPAARNLVLLGDPQQLDQPLQGTHPPGAEVSALEHWLGGAATMPPDRGLFLPQTRRLRPRICAFTSDVFYEGKLTPFYRDVPGDIQIVSVPHTGNQNESLEEVDVIARLVDELVKGGVALNDIVIVAPYNMQVAAIARRLPGARVGTVDKFQGQEARVAIYSTATSSAEDAPRGMTFLYSPNRFNVATSRAKERAIVVASPELFVPECRTPEQMRLANVFCRFRELAAGES